MEKKTKKSGTIIRKCTCQSEFQDQKYGKGMRVHNVTEKGARCTICGKES